MGILRQEWRSQASCRLGHFSEVADDTLGAGVGGAMGVSRS
jgi:hypothetical protein